MIRRIAAAAAAVITGLSVALVGPVEAAQAVEGDGWRRIINVKSTLALQGYTTDVGVRVVQEVKRSLVSGSPTPRQDWLFTVDKGYARFRNAAATDSSGWLALTVNNGVDSLSRPVIQYTNIPGNPAQLWSMREAPGAADHVYTLRNPASGRCLSIPNGDLDPGVQAITYPCNGALDQMWIINDNN